MGQNISEINRRVGNQYDTDRSRNNPFIDGRIFPTTHHLWWAYDRLETEGVVMKTRIHVNQHNIKANAKGARLPVITAKTYKSNTLGYEAQINGPSRVVYSPDKPLSCGAKVWIETDSEVIVL